QLISEIGQRLELPFRISVLDNNVFTFHVAKLMQTLLQCLDAPCRVEAEALTRIPMRGIFDGCWASTTQHVATSREQRARTVIFLFIFFPFSSLDTPQSLLFSLDYFIRSRQHVR